LQPCVFPGFHMQIFVVKWSMVKYDYIIQKVIGSYQKRLLSHIKDIKAACWQISIKHHQSSAVFLIKYIFVTIHVDYNLNKISKNIQQLLGLKNYPQPKIMTQTKSYWRQTNLFDSPRRLEMDQIGCSCNTQ